MKFGVSVSTFPTSFGPIMFSGNLKEDIYPIADLGFQEIDLFIKHADEPGLQNSLKAVHKTGISIGLVAAVSAFVDDGLFLSSPDQSIREELISRMKEQINLASEVGANVPVGVIRGSEGGDDRSKWLAESLFILHHHGEEKGVCLFLEPVNRYETQFINSIPDALSFIDSHDLPKFNLLVDVFHMNIEDTSISDSLKLAGARIGHVHFADSNRRVPGMGHLDWDEIFMTLLDLEYDSFCSIEAIPGDNPKADAGFAIEFLQKKLTKMKQSNSK
jgi:sugar phosphate isomerase/epimerase